MTDMQCNADLSRRAHPAPRSSLVPRVGEQSWLGIELRKDPERAVVVSISPGSPAEEAELWPGDEIIEFDRRPRHSSSELVQLVRQEPVGQRVRIIVVRSGQRLQGQIEVGA
jgi:S1-C subfamily serine protease